MNATLEVASGIDAATMEKVIATATPEQRRYLIDQLLPLVIEDDAYLPRSVHDNAGEIVGLVIPQYRSKATEPPKLTDEQRAELQRRLDTSNDTISFDEMMKRLGLADVPLPRRCDFSSTPAPKPEVLDQESDPEIAGKIPPVNWRPEALINQHVRGLARRSLKLITNQFKRQAGDRLAIRTAACQRRNRLAQWLLGMPVEFDNDVHWRFPRNYLTTGIPACVQPRQPPSMLMTFV
jgi:hypothetical protein